MGKEIKLGSVVNDVLTSCSGTVIAKTLWLYGCPRVIIQPFEIKDGRPVDTVVLDERLVILSKEESKVDAAVVDLEDSRVGLGDRVKDTISGFKGVAVAKTMWLYGCMRITVQPEAQHEGRPVSNYTFDEPQVIVIEQAVLKPGPELVVPDDKKIEPETTVSPTFGDDRPAPTRRPDPIR